MRNYSSSILKAGFFHGFATKEAINPSSFKDRKEATAINLNGGGGKWRRAEIDETGERKCD